MIAKVEEVTKSIKARKTIIEAPVVNIPETVVNVDAPNLKPIETGLKGVEKAVKAIPKPKDVDFKPVITEQKKQTKLLKDIRDTPSGGGGGGSVFTGLHPGKDFDYIGIADTSTLVDTLTYKTGGSGGTAVRTMTVSFASGAEKISASLTSVAYS